MWISHLWNWKHSEQSNWGHKNSREIKHLTFHGEKSQSGLVYKPILWWDNFLKYSCSQKSWILLDAGHLRLVNSWTIRKKYWFQRDGTPLDNTFAVCFLLDAKFPNYWIGSHGPIGWLAILPDLTPLDVLLRRFETNHVSRTSVPNVTQLKQRINTAIRAIS